MLITFRAPDPKAEDARISEADLPRCKACSGLLRPDVVWFGEGLDPAVLAKTGKSSLTIFDGLNEDFFLSFPFFMKDGIMHCHIFLCLMILNISKQV